MADLAAVEPKVSREMKELVLKSEIEQMNVGMYRLITAAKVCKAVDDKQQFDNLKKQIELAESKIKEYDRLLKEETEAK